MFAINGICNKTDMDRDQYNAAIARVQHAFETGLPLQIQMLMEEAGTKVDVFLNARLVGIGQLYANIGSKLQTAATQHTFSTIHNSDALGTFDYNTNTLSVANEFSTTIRKQGLEEALRQLETSIRSVGIHEGFHGADTERGPIGDVISHRAIAGRPEVITAYERDKSSFSALSTTVARANEELRNSPFGTYERYAETVLGIERTDGESLRAYGQRIAAAITEAEPTLVIVADPIAQLERSGAGPILAIAEAIGSDKMKFSELFDVLDILSTASIVFPTHGYKPDQFVAEAIVRVPQLASLIDPAWVERYNEGLRELEGGSTLSGNVRDADLIALGERTFPTVIQTIFPELSRVTIEQTLTHAYHLAVNVKQSKQNALNEIANLNFDEDLFADFDAPSQGSTVNITRVQTELDKYTAFQAMLGNFDAITQGNIMTFVLDGNMQGIWDTVGEATYHEMVRYIEINEVQPLMQVLKDNGLVAVNSQTNENEFTPAFNDLDAGLVQQTNRLLEALFNNPHLR